MKKKSLLSLVAMLSICSTLFAQELEYKMDLGGGIGGCFYLGDVSSTPFKNTNIMGSAIGRYKFNPRMAIKANLAVGRVSGSSEGIFFPEQTEAGGATGGTAATVEFANTLIDLGVQYEQNLWGYGSGEGYKGNKRVSPYLLVGFGFTYAPIADNNVFCINLPVGVGVKYKLRERLNLTFEWSMRFTTSDGLDAVAAGGVQLDAPYGIKSGAFKNKDCYSFAMLSLTYDMFPRYRKCNN